MAGRQKWETWTQFCKLACASRSWRRELLEWSAMQSWLAIGIPGSLFSTLRQFGPASLLIFEYHWQQRKFEGLLLSALPEFSSTPESVALTGALLSHPPLPCVLSRGCTIGLPSLTKPVAFLLRRTRGCNWSADAGW